MSEGLVEILFRHRALEVMASYDGLCGEALRPAPILVDEFYAGRL